MLCTLLYFLEAVWELLHLTLDYLCSLKSKVFFSNIVRETFITVIKQVHTSLSLQVVFRNCFFFGKEDKWNRWILLPVNFRPQRYLAPYPSKNKTALYQKPVPLVNYPSLLFQNGPSENSVACTCLVVEQM